MKKTELILVGIFMTSLLITCQLEVPKQSDYVTSFDWMVKTFEENDAGFKYCIEEKGLENYEKHTILHREKIAETTSEEEYFSLMNSWLHYFRKTHIGVSLKRPQDLSEAEKDSIRQFSVMRDTISFNKKEFQNYLKENSNKINPIEGVWKSKSLTYGVRSSEKNSNQFEVFIIEGDGLYWYPKQKVIDFVLLEDGTFEVVSLGANSSVKIEIRWIGNSNALISIEGNIWKKLYPETKLSERDFLYSECMLSRDPFITHLNKNTLYLRIPSFYLSEKEKIDQLLSQNDNLIRSTANLIIDIRNGTGGGDSSHDGLIPYYYTQPLRYIPYKYRASELNALQYEKYANMYTDSFFVQRNQFIAKKMRECIDDYFELSSDVYSFSGLKKIKLPRRIAIIINKRNGSADEQLLFSARQSYKVKIFGEPSVGAYDCSNVNQIDFPDGKYILSLAMTISNRYPDYRIDDIGIQPDYYIDKSIPEEDWIEFVQKVIEAE